MNGAGDRKLFAEMIILVAVIVGGWMLIVEPKVSELHELEAKIQEAKSNPVLRDHEAVANMAGRLKDVRRHVETIERQSSFGRDSSIMYGRIKDLATEHGVSVRRLDPGGNSRRGIDEGDPLSVVRFVMRVEASFANLARFLAAIAGIEGYVRPVSLNLTPQGNRGAGYVDAQFTCEAVSFVLPDVLAAMMTEDGDVDQ